MKKTFMTAILIFYLVLTAFGSEARVEGGLQFRSYEVAPNLRTSMRIPHPEDGYIRYDGFLNLSFDVKIDTGKECFGYICRIILNDTEYVDILLTNPTIGEAHLALASKHGELMKLNLPTGDQLNEWNHIDLILKSEDNKTSISLNGTSNILACSQRTIQEAEIYFGANSHRAFSTSDVAPMSIRNISLKTKEDSDRYYFWELQTKDDLNGGSGRKKMQLAVENAEWIIESNSSWRLSSSLTFGTRVRTVVDNDLKLIHLITPDCVTTIRPGSKNESVIHHFKQDICFRKLTNDFVTLPGGRLLYIDPEGSNPVVSEFDFNSDSWTHEIRRDINSSCLHHNVFFNKQDSCVIHLFGYGFHKYSNTISRWNEKTGDFKRWTLDSIPPRYLSAAGLSDSLAWIYGGKGNEKGIQELGTTIYNDLYTINLKDYTVRRVRTLESESMEVAAADLIISDDETTFTALFYSPNTYQSGLQMKSIGIEDGKSTVLGNRIPYNFLDVDSEARLIYDEGTQRYYAIITEKKDDGTYRVNIYTISSPVLIVGSDSSEKESGNRLLWLLICLFTVSLTAAAYFMFLRNKRRKGKATATVPMRNERHGIYLIGGFKVINRDGTDISAHFTPLMKQLLCILILNSYRHKGISNAELKEALWADKTEESYYNNRGVNIKKLRTCISELGDLEISSSNGNWSINIDENLCDWFRNMKEMEGLDFENLTTEQISGLISIATKGHLLPDMRYEWTDRFKAQYTDLIISSLSKARQNVSGSNSTDLKISLADAVLIFDSLDEEAVKEKCKALIAQKRLGIAQSTFKNFTQEYQRLMGEEYSINFNEFVR